MHFTQQDITDLDNRYRAHFINSLSGFKSANLIGTCDANGNHNLAIVSSVFHLGANPPLIGMIMRPHSVPRHTLENIQATKVYTINQVNADFYQQAHQTSARYDKNQSEFEQVGLHPELGQQILAPYVAESALKMGLKLISTQTLAVNGTELVIGEIIEIMVDDEAITKDGYVDIELLDCVTVSGLDSYHVTSRLQRLPYAKPK
ncbi:flavin reductase family protein [Motilimonas cestriensis]|uniref:Flavin reductase family protein n=1 Tax=Motilimonas cestriensis TaxID=2742685 RepID=A0ABS8W648_9GAMM|nr:flavin reductase family protein [Motilimonas cestriensis]MCE2594457.1 flavin reductase family protein [Motilimonas cestriensis]